MKNIIKIAVIVSFFSSTALAQQRYITTLGALNGYNNNPAYAGINNCLTINLQGKKQWVDVPNAPTNAHFQLTKRLGRHFGFGFQANYWSAALLSNVQSSGTIAWHIPLGKTIRLGVAANLGFSQISLNSQDVITFQNDPTLNQKQNSGNLFADAGILLHGKNLQLGIASPSVYNLRLGEDLNYLTERYIVANAQYRFKLSEHFSLTPIAIYRSLPTSGYLIDGMLRAELKSRLGIAAGYRTNSGLLASVDVKLNDKIALAYAYDAGLQNLNGLSNGSHEILLGISLCKQENKPRYIQRYATILVKDDAGSISPYKEFVVENLSTGTSQTIKSNEKGMVIFPVDTLAKYSVKNVDKNYESTAVYFTTANNLTADIQKEYNLMHKTAFISGKIVDGVTGKGIPDVKITKTENGIVSTYTTAENGTFKIPVDKSKNIGDPLNFDLKVEKVKFKPSEPIMVNTSLQNYGELPLNTLTLSQDKAINLTPVIESGTINEVLAIKPIYFNYNSFNIRPDAATELEKVIKYLNENPKTAIVVEAHTDCTGSAEANKTLSQKRAQACVDYINKFIVNPVRVTGKGLGESVPLSQTACENKSNDEMAKDRRIEFKIVK